MLKKILAIVAALTVLGAAAFALSFRSHAIALPDRLPDFTLPDANPPPELTLSAVPAGKMFGNAALAYRGGEFSDERTFVSGAIVVRHPQGTLLFDAGFGRNVDAHMQFNSWLARKLTRYRKEATVAEQLAAAGIPISSLKGVVLTHSHWDHVSGVEDLPGVPVLVNADELDFVLGGHIQSALARELGTANYRVYEFKSGPYLGFASSYDVFDDGSVVIVPAPGHTPGSIVAFVTLASGQRYALIGDVVWQREALDIPAERPWLTRSRVDADEEAVRRWIVHLRHLSKTVPNLTIVPAHDLRVWDTLPRL